MTALMLRYNSVSSNSQGTDEDASENRKEISDVVCHDCQHAVEEVWSVNEVDMVEKSESTYSR